MPLNLQNILQGALKPGPTGPTGPSITGPTGPSVPGPTGPSGSIPTDSPLVLTDITASTSTTTGALTVAGGVGVAGTLNASAVGTGNLTITGTTSISEILEKCTINASAPSSTLQFDVLTQSVVYYTSNTTVDWTLNVRGNATTSLNNSMSIGQSLTIAIIVTNGSTPYRQTALTVDGSVVTVKWQGSLAPTSGTANSVDMYALILIKTDSATFTAFESFTKFG